jgi:hypothetical protein
VILYHYTSETAYGQIMRDGKLLPQPQPLIRGRPAVWFTDTPTGEPRSVKARRAIGVDHEMYGDDRTAKFLRLPVGAQCRDFLLWSVVAYEFPGAYALTEAPLGARPDTWWLSFDAVSILPKPEIVL